jgi:hypothetical protein
MKLFDDLKISGQDKNLIPTQFWSLEVEWSFVHQNLNGNLDLMEPWNSTMKIEDFCVEFSSLKDP